MEEVMAIDSREGEQGRVGEILQFFLWLRFGTALEDLADRTERRAPLLYGREGTITSPDASGIKTAPLFVEFKTKSHHEEWRGGSINDQPRYPPRTEEGIDRKKWLDYQRAEQMWRKPVVLSILSIKEGEVIAATLQQLGEPRHSLHESFDLVNWDVRQFNRIASFDPNRLHALFRGPGRAQELRQRWLRALPPRDEINRVLEWLQAQQAEFSLVRQHIFDQTERDFHKIEGKP
jgi:hypothetical protein